jgi:hypothetical protein
MWVNARKNNGRFIAMIRYESFLQKLRTSVLLGIKRGARNERTYIFRQC